MDMICDWSNAHPNANKYDHPLNDTYLNIVAQAIGLRGEELKIMKKNYEKYQ